MLYLAEVKKNKGFMGVKTEVKLLACERNDKTWSPVPGDEVLSAEEASAFNDGTLIVLNLGGNRQIQGAPEPASVRLIGILQNFSRLLEKTKAQEEEIEQWKESLTYQAEELSRRQAEMDSHLEALEGSEEELKKLESQRQEIEKLKAEANQIRAEFEQKQKELEGAWDHLRGEQQRLEELKSEGGGGASLSPEQTERLQTLFEQIQGAIAPTDNFLEKLSHARQFAEQQQQQLKQSWDALEQDRQTYEDLNRQVQAIANEIEQEGGLAEKIHSIEHARDQMEVQQESLRAKQTHLQHLNLILQNYDEMHTSLSSLAAGLGEGEGETIDVSQLESMPLGELESIVNSLKGELDKLVNFVNDQEEELTLQQEAVKELRDKINQTDSNDVIAIQELEEELKDEQERMGMLNETLVGQRRTLRERQSVMRQHLRVLKQRQGVIEVEVETNIDLNPAIARLDSQRQEYLDYQEQLQAEIEKLQDSVRQMENLLSSQELGLQGEKEKLEAQQADYQAKQLECEKLKAKIDLYEASLQPLQDSLNGLNQPLKELEQLAQQLANTSQQQQHLTGELENTLAPLMG